MDVKAPKQTIVVRKDLKMRKGKMAAQVAHASMKVFFDLMEPTEIAWDDMEPQDGYAFPVTPEMKAWKEGIFTKIVVGCESEGPLSGSLTMAESSTACLATTVPGSASATSLARSARSR